MITAVTLLMLAGTAHAERFPAAPSLAETTWLSGAPVAVPTEGVAVVELWATWCGPCIEQLPHLQGLAAHYAGQVHFAAISDEPRRTVEAFWSTRGRFLGEPVFSVGTDPSGETSRRYQRIDQASSIPRSYIVHDGEVVWSGHPAYLDGVLEAVVGDRWDAARAAYLPRAAGRVEDYFTAIKRGKGQEAAAIGAEVVRYADTQPGLLNDMAWAILTEVPEGRRDLGLAVQAATRATEARPDEAAFLDTLAFALFQSRRLEDAVATQRRAVAACPPDHHAYAELSARLVDFQAALSAAGPGGR